MTNRAIWEEEYRPHLLDLDLERLEIEPARFAEKTGNRLVLTGGFDKRILEFGDRTAIRKTAIELLEPIRRNGVRYIFSTDHSVATNISYDDYQYLLDVVRENMYY